MVITFCRNDLPDWAVKAMKTTCDYCGSFIADNSDTGATTARWCLNPSCPGHMMHKIKVLADYFNIKGFGPETALDYIRLRKFKNHFEILPVWFKDTKPYVSLGDVAVLACIEGYGSVQAEKELNSYHDFEEYFSTPGVKNQVLLANRELLLEAEKYFDIKEPLSKYKMYVMGTGSFHGYNNREEYFKLIKDAFGPWVDVIQVGKRKTGVSYLLKEKDAVDHSKSQIARECNIPIVTPSEFFAILQEMFPYINDVKE